MSDRKAVSINVEGMHCEACVRRLRKALEKVPDTDVRDVKVGSVDLVADEVAVASARQAIEKAGFKPR